MGGCVGFQERERVSALAVSGIGEKTRIVSRCKSPTHITVQNCRCILMSAMLRLVYLFLGRPKWREWAAEEVIGQDREESGKARQGTKKSLFIGAMS